jgi:hypothetical protein
MLGRVRKHGNKRHKHFATFRTHGAAELHMRLSRGDSHGFTSLIKSRNFLFLFLDVLLADGYGPVIWRGRKHEITLGVRTRAASKVRDPGIHLLVSGSRMNTIRHEVLPASGVEFAASLKLTPDALVGVRYNVVVARSNVLRVFEVREHASGQDGPTAGEKAMDGVEGAGGQVQLCYCTNERLLKEHMRLGSKDKDTIPPAARTPAAWDRHRP